MKKILLLSGVTMMACSLLLFVQIKPADATGKLGAAHRAAGKSLSCKACHHDVKGEPNKDKTCAGCHPGKDAKVHKYCGTQCHQPNGPAAKNVGKHLKPKSGCKKCHQ